MTQKNNSTINLNKLSKEQLITLVQSLVNKNCDGSIASCEYPDTVVSSIKLSPHTKQDKNDRTLALADVVLNDNFIVRGLRIVDGENGMFVGYPKDTHNPDALVHCSPITRRVRENIENAVLTEFLRFDKALRNVHIINEPETCNKGVEYELQALDH